MGCVVIKGKKRVIFGISALFLVAAAMVSAFAVRKADERLFWTLIIITSVACIVFMAVYLVMWRDFHRFIADSDVRWGLIERDSLYRFPAPALVADADGIIIWYNIAFSEKVLSDDAFGFPVSRFFDIDLERSRNALDSVIEYNTGSLRIRAVSSEKLDSNGVITSKLTMLYFESLQEELSLKAENNLLRTNIMLIAIDNSDELLGHERESEKQNFLIKIDQVLEEYFEKYGGVMRKTSADRYIVVVAEHDLSDMKADKFGLLDSIRNLFSGEKYYASISVGVGKNKLSLADSESDARQALDMAQGRGGDQVVIKSDTDYEFFGGVSGGTEKNNKVRTRMIANSIMSIAGTSDTIILMGHKYSDMDCIGAAAGLAGALRIAYPETEIKICAETSQSLAMPIINRLIDNIPEAENLFIPPEEAEALVTDASLLIIVDTNNKDILESPESYALAKKVIVIDHHRQTTHYVDNALLFHIETYASSASEIVTEIIGYVNDIKKISSYYADALLAGIMLDTKNFIMKTGARTFEAAAFLKKLGADTVAVKKLFADDIESIKKRSKLVASAEIYKRCAIAVDNTPDKDSRIASSQAADEMLAINGADASFVVFKTSAGCSISARSLGALNVQIIMEKLGGGGHHTMAATQLTGVSPKEAKAKLISAIDEYIENST
ncbi:MAG: DHH family phosphoesterase [Ruminococcus sp.]|jgi:c-di-AMP phosphodiesterase-like protein|nr:DHH family phosphoesterase [Ruminococcus sp.]